MAKEKKVVAEFDRFKFYNIDEAVEMVKKMSNEKFDASVEVHVRQVLTHVKVINK